MCKMIYIFFSIIQLIYLIDNASGGVGCGRQAPQYRHNIPAKISRIIGGETAKPHSWPWQISLRDDDFHFCGGTLLRVSQNKEESDLILTAAHCAQSTVNMTTLVVVVGTNTKESKTKGEQQRRVVAIQRHENYANKTNDIAILRLDKPVQFSDTIRPICIAKKNETIPTKRLCVLTGFGRNETDSDNSQDQLKQALAPVHSLETCQLTWKYQPEAWSYAFLCAGPLNANSAACNGDSGGPLICKSEDGSWVQHGVASYVASKECAALDRPPVFARLTTYSTWISRKIKEMSALLKR